MSSPSTGASSADLDWTVVEADCEYAILRHERTEETRRRGIRVGGLASIGFGIHPSEKCDVSSPRIG